MKNNVKTFLKVTTAVLAVILLAVSIVFLIGNTDKLSLSPFNKTFVWETPSYVVKSGDKMYVVDSSKTRISTLDQDGHISNIISGSSGSESFSSTDYIAVTDEYLYVADVVYAASGTRVSEEHIKKFTLDGKYSDTVFSVKYSDGKDSMPAQNGYICWMGTYENEVYFIYYNKSELLVNRITEKGHDIIRIFTGDIPEIWNIAYSAESDKLYMVGKDSLVHVEKDDGSGFEPVSSIHYDERSIFSDIDAYGDRIYATDLGMCQVVSVTDGTVIMGSDDPAENTMVYRVSASESGVAVTDNMFIYSVSASEGITYAEESAEYSGTLYRNILLTWISLAVVIAAAVVFLGAILVSTLKNTRSKYTSVGLLVAIVVIISTAAISTTVLTETFDRLTEASYTSLIRTADVISSSSSSNGIGDAVKEINDITDYGNEAHLFLQQYMDVYCDAAYNSGSNMYYVVYKFNDDMVYGIADYEKTAGAIYPYCPYEGSDYQIVAETGEIVSVAASMDAYGAWSFAITPIFDSDGNVSAVAEFGINMITEQTQNYDLIKSIIIRVAVIILLILLFLIEGMVLGDGISKFRTEKNAKIPYFLRPMMFLTFFASNLSAAFIPQMSLVLYKESGLTFDGTFASALPMSLQLFAIAAAALMAGRLLERYSMKGLMLISCGVQIAGYITIAFSSLASNYLIFCAGHLISGFGIGVVVVALNTLPDRVEDENLRNNYYAGLNAGIIAGVVIGCSVGSYISDMFGHASVFFVSAVIVVLVAVFVIISVEKGRYTPAVRAVSEKRISTVKFLSDIYVLSFIVCVMIPLLILMYFKDYLFPMYGYDNGMDDVSIGNILLFAGASSIVFGPTISEWMFKHLKTTGTVIISSALTCATLIMFGLFPSTETAVASVIILSLATGFGLAGQEVFYSSLPAFRSYGAQRSMSVYSTCDNISQTAGPLLMSSLLFLGYGAECLFLGVGGLALLLVFSAIQLSLKLRGKEK